MSLHGALQDVGLPALLTFLARTGCTGRLRLTGEPGGDLYLAAGRLAGAGSGPWRGLDALDALVLTAGEAAFSLDPTAGPPPPPLELAGPALGGDALAARLNDLAACRGEIAPLFASRWVPAPELTPGAPVAGPAARSTETLTLDGATLAVLLALGRGARTLEDLAGGRGLLPAAAALARLRRWGLVRPEAPAGVSLPPAVAPPLPASQPAAAAAPPPAVSLPPAPPAPAAPLPIAVLPLPVAPPAPAAPLPIAVLPLPPAPPAAAPPPPRSTPGRPTRQRRFWRTAPALPLAAGFCAVAIAAVAAGAVAWSAGGPVPAPAPAPAPRLAPQRPAPSPTPPGPPPGAPTLAPSPTGDSAAGRLAAVAAAEASLRRGRIQAVALYSGGDEALADLRFDLGEPSGPAAGPPRLRLATTYRGPEESRTFERIIVGDRVWDRPGTADWQARPSTEAVLPQVSTLLPRAAGAARPTLGRDAEGPLLEWQDTADGATVTVRLDPASGQPRWMRRATPASGATLTVTYSDWNAPVLITPPA